jgi:cysteinyl-tRNA synthetase
MYNNVTYVRNITDVDDKIYTAASKKNVGIKEFTSQTIMDYHRDLDELNVLPATHEPLVTEHISEIISFIGKLISTGHAYATEGHVFFAVSSSERYGCLSKKNKEELRAGSRIEVSELKKNPLDFVLWKPADNRYTLGWESPWSLGRPGWHIECSTLAQKYLGDIFDIHGGGFDLVFPHHENEIAQTCAYSGRQIMANYWIHNGHLTVHGDKMSKSTGNFITVRELCEKYDGEVIRLALLTTHYASPMNFDFSLLERTKRMLDRWYTAIRDVNTEISTTEIDIDIVGALYDDMNTPRAISIANAKIDEINKLCKKENLLATFINTCRNYLGIMTKDVSQWFCNVSFEKRLRINSKIKERALAKSEKNFALADAIRRELYLEGITLEDSSSGTIWKTI